LDTTWGHCVDWQIEIKGPNLIATVQYWRGGRSLFSRRFEFDFVAAYGFYDEMTRPVYPEVVGDQLCEVFGSEWIKRFEQRRSTTGLIRRHFAICLSDCGLLEVCCSTVSVSPEVAVDER
jgi:hypothetical protein